MLARPGLMPLVVAAKIADRVGAVHDDMVYSERVESATDQISWHGTMLRWPVVRHPPPLLMLGHRLPLTLLATHFRRGRGGGGAERRASAMKEDAAVPPPPPERSLATRGGRSRL
jgi:hypothetical protein